MSLVRKAVNVEALQKQLEDVTAQLSSIQEEIDHLLGQQESLQQRRTLLVSQLDELACGESRHYNDNRVSLREKHLYGPVKYNTC